MVANKSKQHKKALVEALTKTLGIVTPACEMVGICRATFYKYINTDPEFKNAVKDIDEITLDFVESKLFKLIKDGNPAGIFFYLKTKGKSRGYIETTNYDHSGTLEIKRSKIKLPDGQEVEI